MRAGMALVTAALLAGCGDGEEKAQSGNETVEAVANEQLNVLGPEDNVAVPEENAAAPAADAPANDAAVAEEPGEAAEKAPAAEAKAPAAAAAPAEAPKAVKAVAVARPASFAMCQTCHSTGQGEAHRIGPNLFGIVGAKAGSKPGFNYSDAMKDSGIAWSRDRLDAFIAAPRAVVPGTKMVIAGPKDAAKRKEIVDYLATLR